VTATLDPQSGKAEGRQARFAALREEFQGSAEPYRRALGAVMESFEAGLFVGGEGADWPWDNLDLERWFKLPKSHERHIHGHRHAGVRIVQEGPTLVLALDAHRAQGGPFSAEQLHPYRHSQVPTGQRVAIDRRKVMRKARSKKKRPVLLAELERRYLGTD
jgi:hypothetical protein